MAPIIAYRITLGETKEPEQYIHFHWLIKTDRCLYQSQLGLDMNLVQLTLKVPEPPLLPLIFFMKITEPVIVTNSSNVKSVPALEHLLQTIIQLCDLNKLKFLYVCVIESLSMENYLYSDLSTDIYIVYLAHRHCESKLCSNPGEEFLFVFFFCCIICFSRMSGPKPHQGGTKICTTFLSMMEAAFGVLIKLHYMCDYYL